MQRGNSRVCLIVALRACMHQVEADQVLIICVFEI